MKQGEVFNIVEVWADWNKHCSKEPNFTKYEEISDRLTTAAAIYVAVDLYKEQNGMTGEGYDHFFNISEYAVDSRCEGSKRLISSINYECWEATQ